VRPDDASYQPITVEPLTPARWAGLRALFSEGGDPKWCWCMFWRYRAKDFATSTVAGNRADLEARAAEEPAPGLVAIDGERVVGWVSLGPRSAFERLERSRTIPRIDDRPVWSIVCFVVGRETRGSGLSRTLIDAAVRYARDHGAPAIEAYPADVEGERISPSAAYTGTLSSFLAAGFVRVADTDSSTGGRPRVIVRRELDRPRTVLSNIHLAGHIKG
jgi:GNAT superfamily N-acetyltransferase